MSDNNEMYRREVIKGSGGLFLAGSVGSDDGGWLDFDMPWEDDLKIVDNQGNVIHEDPEELIFRGAISVEETANGKGVQLVADPEGLWNVLDSGALSAGGKNVKDVDHLKSQSHTTEAAQIGGLVGTEAGVTEANLSAKAKWSWGNIDWEDYGSAIESGDSLSGSAAYATVLHGPSVFDNPIADWYFYWSSHDHNSIGLSTAADPFSSLNAQGGVLSDTQGTQTASPHVVHDPENDRVIMFYHVNGGGGQWTKYATCPTTGDGTSWTIQGEILDKPFNRRWDAEQRTYFRGYRRGSGWVGVYQARDNLANPQVIGVAHSQDGVNWTTETEPAFDNALAVASQNYVADGGLTIGAPMLTPIGGDWHLLYQHRDPNEIRAAPFDQRHTPSLSTGETVYTPPGWFSSSLGIAPNAVFTDGTYLYLLYNEESSTDDRNLGIARSPIAEVGR